MDPRWSFNLEAISGSTRELNIVLTMDPYFSHTKSDYKALTREYEDPVSHNLHSHTHTGITREAPQFAFSDYIKDHLISQSEF